ncbi:hypothetical protein [Anaerosalibacter sp. Marseille-P3206]|uniref:hypothetical protein n=1 Tax=Anaerosalibacter sp. Marseille-P3206 TaxID=1871005 RepID=UPI000984F8BB|nr:hypothetical protein [Anaerosalibacter sp. Marseille-P3206]
MDDKVLKLLENLNGQLEQIQNNMVTKDEIANLVTKDEIANLVTKDEITNLVTKDEIANLVTKDEITNLATKDEINLLADELHTEIQAVLNEVKELRHDLNTMEIITTKNAFDIAKLKSVK